MRLESLRQFKIVLLVLLLAGCAEQEQPVTKEEAAQMARKIEDGIKRRNAENFNNALDAEAVVERMKNGNNLKVSSAMLKGAAEGLKTGRIGSELIQSMGKGGSYELVKQYEKDKKQHLIFRLWGGDGKINYHDLELIKKKDQVKIADFFIYMTGENISTTLAQALTMMDENYDSMSKEGKQSFNDMKKIRKLLNEGKHAEADKLYQQLPDVMKQQKMVKLARIEITSELGNDVYMQALDDFERDYPDAPNMFLMKIDATILRKDYQGAMKAVNQLDSLINKDALLDYHRGLISNLTEDQEGRKLYFERLVKNKPDFTPGMLELIVYYMENKETEKAKALTKRYKSLPDFDADQLEAMYLQFPDLRES